MSMPRVSSLLLFASGAILGLIFAPVVYGPCLGDCRGISGSGSGFGRRRSRSIVSELVASPACAPCPPLPLPLQPLSLAHVSTPSTVTATPRDGSCSASSQEWDAPSVRPANKECLPCSPTGITRAAPPPAGLGADGWLPSNRFLSLAASRGPAVDALASLDPELRPLAESAVFFMLARADVRREVPLATWAAGLPHVSFVGDTTCSLCDIRVTMSAPDSWEMLAHKNAVAWPALLSAYPTIKFFVKVDTDGYLVVANLLEALALHRTSTGAYPDYMGHVFTHPPERREEPVSCDEPLQYASGGAGYVLSRRAAEAMAACTIPPGAFEDMFVGRCLCLAGIAPVHHGGFLADSVPDALSSWLISPIFHPNNHNLDATVPAALVSLHGYKHERDLLAVDALVRAKDVSSLRHRLGGEKIPPVDNRPIWDVCCTAHPDGPQ